MRKEKTPTEEFTAGADMMSAYKGKKIERFTLNTFSVIWKLLKIDIYFLVANTGIRIPGGIPGGTFTFGAILQQSYHA